MPKQIQLNIAEPCHEDWGKMTPDEKGRFCGSCQKQVVDFSNMSDRQVAEFFKKPSTGSVCGRFMTDQLDRSIEIPKKRIPWLKYFFQVAIPAFLVTLKASAVRAPAFKQEQTDAKDTTRKPVYEELRTMGMIAMPVQKPIAKKDTVVNPVKKPELNVKGEIDVKIMDVDTSYIMLPEVILQTMGQVKGRVITMGSVAKIKKEELNCTNVVKAENKELVRPTLIQQLTVYPNPVIAGTAITLSSKSLVNGPHQLEFISLSGQRILQREIQIDPDAGTWKLDIPQVSAGSFFIVLTNKQNGSKYSAQLIVQSK